MASAPSPIVSAKQELSKISAYLKAHERLLVIVLCLGVGIHFYSKILTFLEHHDQRNADAAHAALAQQQAENANTAKANQEALAQYQQMVADLKQQNSTLLATIVARDAATQKQQAADRQLPPPALASRWETLIGMPEGVVPAASGFTVSAPAAQETVVNLEQVPQLKADLQDEQGINKNLTTQLGSLEGLNQGLNKQIDGLTIENNQQVQACEADKKVLKDKARKGKLKWFGIGFITGFIGGKLLGAGVALAPSLATFAL